MLPDCQFQTIQDSFLLLLGIHMSDNNTVKWIKQNRSAFYNHKNINMDLRYLRNTRHCQNIRKHNDEYSLQKVEHASSGVVVMIHTY